MEKLGAAYSWLNEVPSGDSQLRNEKRHGLSACIVGSFGELVHIAECGAGQTSSEHNGGQSLEALAEHDGSTPLGCGDSQAMSKSKTKACASRPSFHYL